MKKMAGIMVLVVGLSSVGFAQENASSASRQAANHRYAPSDMMLGYIMGSGINGEGDIFNLKKGFFVANAYLGVNYDFYFFNWLSASTGLYLLELTSVVLKEDLSMMSSDLSITDMMQTPVCLTIPVSAHVNVPRAEWLYLGAGVNFNIPLFSLLDTAPEVANVDLPDTKGSFFISVPIDIGIDIAKGTGSRRFAIRITPNFLKSGTLVTYGIMWQNNSRIYRKS
ncbi:MAG: hypothetical protein LBK61_05940 [Spirochaetaceae bacterium]|jgi:hypothetical protein|nr:hypothetical protein [Spirochaetaceae bacterium]